MKASCQLCESCLCSGIVVIMWLFCSYITLDLFVVLVTQTFLYFIIISSLTTTVQSFFRTMIIAVLHLQAVNMD